MGLSLPTERDNLNLYFVPPEGHMDLNTQRVEGKGPMQA